MGRPHEAHTRIQSFEAEVDQLFAQLLSEPDTATRLLLGRELHRAMQRYVAMCLTHFDDEERHLMPRLWALYEDDELLASFGRIMALIGPAERDWTMEHLVQSLSPTELAAVRAKVGAEEPQPA